MISNDYGNGMVMPVAPMYGNSSNGWGGFGGDGAWWLLVLFLFAFNGNGWGMGNNGMYPYMQTNTNNDIQRGFDQQAVISGINGVQSAVNGLGNQMCNSTAAITSAVNTGFSAAEASNNARQMADMQQNFALQSQLAQCCCDNRLATANLNATILSENCADRAALSDGIRDILVNQTANTQRLVDTTTQAVQGVYDKLCQLELNAKDDTIADLRNQLNQANLASVVNGSTARVLADNAAQTVALEQYLNPSPVPAYTVQNPRCCANYGYNNCGCAG